MDSDYETEKPGFKGHATSNDSEDSKPPVYVRELRVQYIGPRRRNVAIRESSDAKLFLDGVQKDNSREHFMALFLDGAHQVVGYATISTGTATSTQVHPREVFQPAILAGSVAVIVAHNHPSGDLKPSDEDRYVTKKLVEAGKIVGIRVLDLLILCDDSF